jgi:hypothetical protein
VLLATAAPSQAALQARSRKNKKKTSTTAVVTTRVGTSAAPTTKAVPTPTTPATRPPASNRTDPRLRAIGFTSRSKLHDHFLKHGREFGNITEAQYLSMAQDLRDAPLSKTIIETEQVGGTVSRFNRSTGAFLAFNTDLTIRTFFRPDDGENYFWRASRTSH